MGKNRQKQKDSAPPPEPEKAPEPTAVNETKADAPPPPASSEGAASLPSGMVRVRVSRTVLVDGVCHQAGAEFVCHESTLKGRQDRDAFEVI